MHLDTLGVCKQHSIEWKSLAKTGTKLEERSDLTAFEGWRLSKLIARSIGYKQQQSIMDMPMTLPKVSSNDIQERIGVSQVALDLSKKGIVFRETPNTDVGIDGQIEYVSHGDAIGRLAAVQIKSGSSYLIDKGSHYAYYPKDKHKTYWEGFPLPVLLMLHDPSTDKVYFTDARYYLSIPEHGKQLSYIPIPKANVLSESKVEVIFGMPVSAYPTLLTIDHVLSDLVSIKSNCASFPISFFELFVNGLTNLCRHSYFSMSLASQIADVNLELIEAEFGLGVGNAEHEFLNSYVGYVYSQKLVKIDYSDYLIDWVAYPQNFLPLQPL